MARTVRSANADPHERAENRLLRKFAALHQEKVVMAHKPHESKAEERRAGRKGAKAEPEKAKAKGGRDSHHGKAAERKGGAKGDRKLHRMAEGHKAEHKMAEVHVHHHHHHHHGAKK